ncbi:MAG: hypothetical protein K8S25_13785 [Alphaproteobacteria bacterium]|nr:hypothetical protein [Alphaproteobacteria bacterium]
MRKVLLTTAAFAFIGAGSAMAADTANVEITAEQAPVCDITAVSGSIPLAGVNVAVPGLFEYECNFEGSPTFTFTSANGGVETTDNGGGIADYGIFLNDQTPAALSVPLPSDWQPASGATAGVVYGSISLSAPPNTTITPYFSVGLTQPLPVAGSYSDTLTIDIAP